MILVRLKGKKSFKYPPNLFYKDANRLVQILQKEQFARKSFDVIIGLSQGSVPLMLHMANSLEIPESYLLRFSSKEDHTINVIKEPPWKELRDSRILVVDYLINEESEVQFVKQKFSQEKIDDYKLLALIDKRSSPHLKLDYFSRKTDDWVTFFWEREFYPSLS